MRVTTDLLAPHPTPALETVSMPDSTDTRFTRFRFGWDRLCAPGRCIGRARSVRCSSLSPWERWRSRVPNGNSRADRLFPDSKNYPLLSPPRGEPVSHGYTLLRCRDHSPSISCRCIPPPPADWNEKGGDESKEVLSGSLFNDMAFFRVWSEQSRAQEY